MPAYLLRLLCLSLASFFLVHLASGLLVRLFVPAAIRAADKMRPRSAARLLFTLRLLPVGLALFLVAVLCVPSYLRLEPAGTVEPIGLACLAAAFCGTALWAAAVRRGARAIIASLRYVRRCESVPLVALTGILRPRLVISQTVIRALSRAQLDTVIRHEHAHRISHDNLKRLLVVMAPRAFSSGRLRALDRAWGRFTEWAADDVAVAGDARRSVSLAAALVRVARLTQPFESSPLASSLLGDSADLAARVDRLLREPRPERADRTFPVLAGGAAIATAGVFFALASHPVALSTIHTMLERLIQ